VQVSREQAPADEVAAADAIMLQQQISKAAEGTSAAKLSSSLLVNLTSAKPCPEKQQQQRSTAASGGKSQGPISSSSSKHGTSIAQKAKGPLIVELGSTSGPTAAAAPCKDNLQVGPGNGSWIGAHEQLLGLKGQQQQQLSSRSGKDGCHGLGQAVPECGQVITARADATKGPGKLLKAGFLTKPSAAAAQQGKQQQRVCKEGQGLPPPRSLQPQKIKAGVCKGDMAAAKTPPAASFLQGSSPISAPAVDTATCLDVLSLAGLFAEVDPSCPLPPSSANTEQPVNETAAAGASAVSGLSTAIGGAAADTLQGKQSGVGDAASCPVRVKVGSTS
jgi:hypothetical protein